MEYKLRELMDIPKLQFLLDSLDAICGIPSAIIDTDGNVIASTEWQDICTKFHRINSETMKLCKENDMYIISNLKKTVSHTIYKCPMGLIDAATPVIVGGRHIGNIFTGQLFTEPPDEKLFVKQAKIYNFNEKEYIEALRNVPIVSQDRLDKNLQFLGKFTELLAEQGLQNKYREEDRDRLFTILNSMDSMVYVADMDTHILLFANDSLRRTFGDVVGKVCWQTLQRGQNGPCPFCTNDKLVTKDGEPANVYKWEVCNTKTSKWVRCMDRAIRWIDGRLVRFEIATDFTEEKKAEEKLDKYQKQLEEMIENRTILLTSKTEELTESRSALLNLIEELNNTAKELVVAKERAETADRLKSVFLATMSHELRTPLNSIIGFTSIILQGFSGPLNKEQSKQLTMVKNSAYHLLSLINDILDISKIESGQLNINVAPFDMSKSIEITTNTIRSFADKKGLKIDIYVDPLLSTIVSDERRVEQILFNLLSNAVKFTEKGEIKVECYIEDECVTTRVIDTGIGIKQEDMESLFKPFVQLENGLSRRYEGTGLGLSISKKLVEILGGKIYAKSEFGKGSTFTFSLPIRQGQYEARTDETERQGTH